MLNRRTVLTAGLYTLAALNLPPTPAAAARAGQPRRAGGGDVERIRAMTAQFADADSLFGGGHARTAVASYLVAEVTPLLHGTTGAARPALFTAASQLAYLAGFMANDACMAGLAQRYYIQAVRLADEAGDPVAKATALRGLALQAVEIGHPDRAVHLAEAAAAALDDSCPPRVRAWMNGMRANAYAAGGDTRAAIAALTQAEGQVERAESPPESQWTGAYRRASLEHDTGTTLAALSDLATGERHMVDSIRVRRGGERRSRVLITSRLAGMQLRQRRVDEAAATVLGMRADLPLVSSARVAKELSALRAGWTGARSPGSRVEEADRLIASVTR
ncbi:hypothetical protein F5972_08275 [Microbispora cellulosiformans]|uniref:Transcriptional regulator n=2 Tax=Microbispora cellulosiformans TaxID=2614688 RepID=A0A5J5K6A9_9ACTN|nr:hypothetical protein F5972_08275 [Microbispora cellulosiformans]